MSKLTLVILFVGLVQHALVAPTIDHSIVNQLRQKPTIDVIVTMKDSTKSVLNNLRIQTFASREDRLNGVAHSLMDFAASSQKNVIALLKKEQPGKPFAFTELWISNQISIKDADMDLLQKLATLNDIATIEQEKYVQLEEPMDLNVVDDLGVADEDEVQWGVKQIGAPVLWDQGIKGQTIIIGTVDTGARGTHEALKSNFAGKFGWFDPSGATLTPNDGNGHGTHTTANIAGTARNVGVAPQAKWVACKGCATSACAQSDLTRCAQFMACPTTADGAEKDCKQAPHLVSNSWGGGRATTWFQPSVDAWEAAGIITLFSIGNSGPSCGSANSPGDYRNVIGVGSTTEDNELSYFSSVGPTTEGARIKPDIAAPGSNVFSAYHTSDTAYASMSGTSMACPHAAGTVALLLSKKPNSNYQQVLASLKSGGVAITSGGKECSGIPDTQYPNHHAGSGRIDAVKTIASTDAY
jgi:subtilisin family serine protease